MVNIKSLKAVNFVKKFAGVLESML